MLIAYTQLFRIYHSNIHQAHYKYYKEQFSVILHYKREIAAPTPESDVNFPFVIQND